MAHIVLDSYGVKLDVEVQDETLLPAVERILPPDWRRFEGFPEDGHLTIRPNPRGGYDVMVEELEVADGVAADVAVHLLDAQLRNRIAFLARERIFIHSGAVAVDGRAIVLPGPSFAGKSALVGALVEAGAVYYSDEFAVLDHEGRVHPYPRLLSIRQNGQRYGTPHDVGSMGGAVGQSAAEVTMIAVTQYRPGSTWSPAVGTPGQGALALLANAVAGRFRSAEALSATAHAAAGAVFLEGDRGEADEAAAALLGLLSS